VETIAAVLTRSFFLFVILAVVGPKALLASVTVEPSNKERIETLLHAEDISATEVKELVTELQRGIGTMARRVAVSGQTRQILLKKQLTQKMDFETRLDFISVMNALPADWLREEGGEVLHYDQASNSVDFILELAVSLRKIRSELPDERLPVVNLSVSGDDDYINRLRERNRVNWPINDKISAAEKRIEEFERPGLEGLARYLFFDDADRSIATRIQNSSGISEAAYQKIMIRHEELAGHVENYRKKQAATSGQN